jgi:hypothetical protein
MPDGPLDRIHARDVQTKCGLPLWCSTHLRLVATGLEEAQLGASNGTLSIS